jgi:flagellar basal body-associated protein FliL
MQKKRKTGLREGLQNISTMLIFIFFVVLCVVIAGVIGVYSVHKANKNHVEAANETAGTEDVQEPTDSLAENSEITASQDEKNSEEDTQDDVDEPSKSTGETVLNTEASTADENSTTADASAEVVFQETSKDLTITLYHTGGWGDETDLFVQYEMLIDNTGSQDVSNWSVELSVSDEAVCNNIWNGVAQVEDGIFRVDAADFNSQIMAGSQTSVGIIIEQPGTVQFLDVTVE